VTIIRNDDMAAPGVSAEVADIDAVHAIAVEWGFEIAYPLRDEDWRRPTLHASPAERHGRQRPVPPFALSA
jgi:hypothetical protein